MIKLPCNKCNGHVSSSSHRLKICGSPKKREATYASEVLCVACNTRSAIRGTSSPPQIEICGAPIKGELQPTMEINPQNNTRSPKERAQDTSTGIQCRAIEERCKMVSRQMDETYSLFVTVVDGSMWRAVWSSKGIHQSSLILWARCSRWRK